MADSVFGDMELTGNLSPVILQRPSHFQVNRIAAVTLNGRAWGTKGHPFPLNALPNLIRDILHNPR
jgi:hypothetical protein